jgi:hypothetical protein
VIGKREVRANESTDQFKKEKQAGKPFSGVTGSDASDDIFMLLMRCAEFLMTPPCFQYFLRKQSHHGKFFTDQI